MHVYCAYDEMVDIDRLIPNPYNANRHSVEQIQRLAKIIDFNGWRSPITVSRRSGFITKGHCRLEAAKLLGYKKVPVDYQEYENEAKEYSDVIADNEIARWAKLDKQAVYERIQELPEINVDLLGIEEFTIDPIELNELELPKDEDNPKLTLQIKFTNQLDMQDLYDDLTHKGYAVKKL